MALGKNKKIINLVQSISEMKEENYAAGSPELQNMYERMSADVSLHRYMGKICRQL